MNSLFTFLNTNFGVLLAGSAFAALGLFTWQRQDWLFKERYQRSQVMLDRQLDIMANVNKDAGRLIALAASISAPVLKGGVSDEQTFESIRAYNEFQSHWFGICEAYKASIAFYFPPAIIDAFDRVTGAMEDLDLSLAHVTTTEGADKAYNAGLSARAELKAWNRTIAAMIRQ